MLLLHVWTTFQHNNGSSAVSSNNETTMSNEIGWVRLTECATGFEADLLKSDLEEADIPVLLRGPQVGMFGGGFQGNIVGGLEVLVPSPEVERAQAILEGSVKPEP